MKTFLLTLLFGVGMQAQVVSISDAAFKARLLQASTLNDIAQDFSGNAMVIDTNSDGEIQVSEALAVHHLKIYSVNVQSMAGVEAFANLRTLNCEFNSIDTLDVTSLPHLQQLLCRYNQMTSLNVAGLQNLTLLECYENDLSTLDLTGLNSLEILRCYDNELATLNVTGLINLVEIIAGANMLTSLDASNLPNLKTLTSSFCFLTSIDVTGSDNIEKLTVQENLLTELPITNLTLLRELTCSGNPLATIDLHNAYQLEWVTCSSPELETLYIKNGANENVFIPYTEQPVFICADEFQIADVEADMAQWEAQGLVNSYCTFEPGGRYNFIAGTLLLDADGNGCDPSDVLQPLVKLILSDGTNTVAQTMTDNTSTYNFYPGAGTFTVTPQLEHPEYFSVSPATATATFVDEGFHEQVLDFCITANGIHPDAEVTIIPLGAASPGFDASYRVLFHNKGNQILSGSVVFGYDETVLDFVSADVTPDLSASGSLTWNYLHLLPFESRHFDVEMNLNSPMETPPVNNGDVLSFTASVNHSSLDDTPLDNIFELIQTVVGSFDPNDKTCLEGSLVSPEKIGEYLHYMIRFENTGTAPAQNVVVKDVIDTSKYDLQSLQLISMSHPGITRITENVAEFIFEGINLPFEDATNDGYVVFKIKTKNTLTLGSTVTNSAEIYFDYNFPIVTNNAATTFQSLGVGESSFETIGLHPNPAATVLNVSSVSNMSSFAMYDTAGRKVTSGALAGDYSSLDVSMLERGLYLLKIETASGTKSAKFIKQ